MMTPEQKQEAERKCIHELKALLHRWSGEESDLDDQDVLGCVNDALEEYFDEEVIEFESDIDLDEIEEEGD
jgi:hypothetical protein